MSSSRNFSDDDDDDIIMPDDDANGDDNRQQSSTSLTKTFVLLSICSICYGLSNSLYGPLFIRYAQEKGLSPVSFSLIIGCYHLTSLIFTPLIGMWVQKISTKYILCTGLMIIGISNSLFGALEWVDDSVMFLSLAFAIRVFDGFGAASVRSATFAVSASLYPSQLWTTFIDLELCFGIGSVIGPIAGGALYDYLGFKLPFMSVGVLVFLISILVFILFKDPDEITVKISREFWSMFSHVGNVVYFFSVFTTSFYSGFLEPSLQPHLQKFGLNALFTGIIFQTPDAVWSLTAYLFKWKIKKGFNSVMLIFVANVLLASSIILVAPASFINLETSVGIVVGALVLKGFGQCAKNLCSFHGSFTDSVHKGFSNDAMTYTFVFQMYVIGTSAGFFCGSSIVGYFYGKFRFDKSVYLPLGCEVIMIPFVLMYAFSRQYRRPIPFNTPEESQPILS